MSENATVAVAIACLTLLAVLFAGEPDIADAIMVRLIEAAP